MILSRTILANVFQVVVVRTGESCVCEGAETHLSELEVEMLFPLPLLSQNQCEFVNICICV